MKAEFAAVVTVEWGDEPHELILTPKNWLLVRSGKALLIRGRGYRYEDTFFWDYWEFRGGLEGTLLVKYGNDGGVGFEGLLKDAKISELEWPSPKR